MRTQPTPCPPCPQFLVSQLGVAAHPVRGFAALGLERAGAAHGVEVAVETFAELGFGELA